MALGFQLGAQSFNFVVKDIVEVVGGGFFLVGSTQFGSGDRVFKGVVLIFEDSDESFLSVQFVSLEVVYFLEFEVLSVGGVQRAGSVTYGVERRLSSGGRLGG